MSSDLSMISLTERYINSLMSFEDNNDTEGIANTIAGMNRAFSVMTPQEKTAVLDWLVGRLIEARRGG